MPRPQGRFGKKKDGKKRERGNNLFKRKKFCRFTAERVKPDNIKAIEAKRADLEKAANSKLEAAQAQATKIEGMTLDISQKAGVDGRLFGSVTNADIVEALNAKGVELEKSAVRMPAGP